MVPAGSHSGPRRRSDTIHHAGIALVHHIAHLILVTSPCVTFAVNVVAPHSAGFAAKPVIQIIGFLGIFCTSHVEPGAGSIRAADKDVINIWNV